MRQFIPLATPSIEEDDIDAVVNVLKTGMLVQGKEVAKLEESVAQLVGVEHAVAVSSGTATLHLALVASGVERNDEVIVPAFSFVATANVVELVGARPIFVDIEADSFNIDVSKIEDAITPRTKAIIPVHEFGLPCDIDGVEAVARKHGLVVIEDAACALGATVNRSHVGYKGNLCSFSFHPRKAISSGEGGVITTRDSSIAQTIRVLRNHGMSTVDGKIAFTMAGYNYRLTDFQAALLNSQLKRLPAILGKKAHIAESYRQMIGNPLVTRPVVTDGMTHSWQTYHVVLDDRLDRDATIARLRERGIGTNYGAQCIPLEPYYQTKYNLDCQLLFPNALRAFRHGLALPIYDKLNHDDVNYILTAVNEINL